MAALSLGEILAGNADLQPQPSEARVRSARSQGRAAAWRRDLEQWRAYRLAMANSSFERERIEADYVVREAEGPDFVHHHARSDYSEPPAHRIDTAKIAEMLRAFDAVRAWCYRNQRKPRGQGISKIYRDVLLALLGFAKRYGKAYPSHATLARMCCCSPRTVANALAWLRLWGFLSWQRRLKRVPNGLGPIVRQTSNAYSIALEGLAALGSRIFSRSSDRNHCNPSPSNNLSKLTNTEKLAFSSNLMGIT